jgi:hypothetical protein
MRIAVSGWVVLICFFWVVGMRHSDGAEEKSNRAATESSSGRSGNNVASLPAAVRAALDKFVACADTSEILPVNATGEYHLCKAEVVWSPGSIDQLRGCLKRRSPLEWSGRLSHKTRERNSYVVSLFCSEYSGADLNIEGSAEGYQVDEIHELMP